MIVPGYQKALNLATMQRSEVKNIKIVRTVAGMRRYQQDKGSIIIRDGAAPLDALQAAPNDIAGYEKLIDKNGNAFYIGQENGNWVIRDPATNQVMHTTNYEADAYTWLNAKVGGSEGSLKDESSPFDASPNVKPTDSQARQDMRRELSDPKYDLDVPSATAVDQLPDQGMQSYQRSRDRGLNHQQALRDAHRAVATERSKKRNKKK